MRTTLFAAGFTLVLAGCADPLADIPKIAEVELSQTEGAAAALPTDAEITREGLVDAPALDVQTAVNVPKPTAAPAPKRTGLLGLLRRAPLTEASQEDSQQDIQATEIAQAVAAAQQLPAGETQDGPTPSDAALTQAPVVVAAIEPATKPMRSRLLGLIGRAVPAADKPDSDTSPVANAVAASQAGIADAAPNGATDAAAVAQDQDTQTAALAPEPKPAPAKRGLFGKRRAAKQADAPRTGPDARDVPYGTIVPFGVVARVCEAKGQNLGKRVEKAPARGFALHDSALGTAGARTWYITGFADGCPRQLTGANVLIGSADLYETLHYGPGGKNLPYGETDKAYEQIKRKVCGARKGKPCGSKIGEMEKSTFFVSAYERFGNSSRWSELVIHDGTVVAATIKPN